ncbi:uncharacterized protein M6B38_290875 [Iris pallida]|uniref:Uncharacterized protein n=1 Tax=Iris pallida TaxID=29817 RepID=A0AAX6HVA9_IRIPA|nr:uncharacterized protein M6B38_290875 [Iris pallida]
MLSSFLILISDDDSDDLSGKKRARVRRKRKKHGHRGSVRGEVLRSLRFLRKWWPVLVFLPPIGLLLFESSKLATDRKVEADAERIGISDPESAKEPPPANLTAWIRSPGSSAALGSANETAWCVVDSTVNMEV